MNREINSILCAGLCVCFCLPLSLLQAALLISIRCFFSGSRQIPAPVMPRAYPAGFPNRAVLFRQKKPPLMISDRSLVRRLRFIGVSYGSPIFSSVATQARKKDTPLRTVTSFRRLSIRSAAPASP